MQNKTVVITGSSDGIGEIVARALNGMGAEVIVIGREPDKTKNVAESINSRYYIVDFTSFAQVKDLAAKLNKDCKNIDVLMNNAGGIFGARELTVDGHEKTLQVNHLSHFLLTNLLLEKLIANKASVISTSSIASKNYSSLDMNDLELESGYSPNRAYGNAKLANILFTKGLHAKYHGQGISAAAVHPGIVATSFAKNTTSKFRFIYNSPLAKYFLDSPAKGAEPLIELATTKDWQSGEYYNRFALDKTNPPTQDQDLIEKFWQASLKMAGLS